MIPGTDKMLSKYKDISFSEYPEQEKRAYLT